MTGYISKSIAGAWLAACLGHPIVDVDKYYLFVFVRASPTDHHDALD